MDKYKYIKHFPKPLLEDILHYNCIPFIGAGFSCNANFPNGLNVKQWTDLGKAFADDLLNYTFSSPIDAITTYEQEYSRAKMVEKMKKELLIVEGKPGDAHLNFAKLYFDKIVTTNFDLLLEASYNAIARPTKVVVDESQLSIACNNKEVEILKIHGDVNHPIQMVATEEDYDGFLINKPLMSTYLCNLLVTRTPIFIGYSLDDTDFRQIYHVIKSRLGNLRRSAYVLSVDANATEIARFKRRGVNVINLPGVMSDYPQILANTFSELLNYQRENMDNVIKESNDAKGELMIPGNQNRLCFVLASSVILDDYKDQLYDCIQKHGLIPISINDLAGTNYYAEIDVIMNRSAMVVIDLDSEELSTKDSKIHVDAEMCIFISEDKERLKSFSDFGFQVFVKDLESENILPIQDVDAWITEKVAKLSFEAKDLIENGFYKQAVVSAYSNLIYTLHRLLEVENCRIPFITLIYKCLEIDVVKSDEIEKLRNWNIMRNRIVHENICVTKDDASEIVLGIEKIINRKPKYE